jgi:transcriptional antiterminator RfaH
MSIIAQIPCTTTGDCATTSSAPPAGNAPGCGSHRATPDPRWFCVQTHSQAERWAHENLTRQGYATFLPLVTERRPDRVTPSMTHKVEMPLFRGYLFVRFCPLTDQWRPIVSTRGVRRLFLTETMRPIPVRRGQIEKFMEQSDARSVLAAEMPAFAEGELLRVTAGPFADHEGVCLWSSETRTRLLMQVLGSEIAVDVARGAVTAVEPMP